MNGVIKAKLTAKSGGMTYRQQTARLMSAQAWLMLIMDLGLGPYADQPLSAWQESFLPAELQNNVRDIRVPSENGGTKSLVQSEVIASPNRLSVPPASPPDLRVPLGIAGLIFAALILIAWRYAKLAYALLGTVFLLFAGIAGLLMLILWTLTAHHSAWANANLLFLNPLAFLLITTLWRARRGIAPSRLANGIVMGQLVALLIALGMHLLPGTIQQNQPWILFALPCWLALAWTFRRANA